MKKHIKLASLSGPALDYMVLIAMGYEDKDILLSEYGPLFKRGFIAPSLYGKDRACPSASWEQGGRLLEKCLISLVVPGADSCNLLDSKFDTHWKAMKINQETKIHEHEFFGETLLIAAMRAFVSFRLNLEHDPIVLIPEKLL